MRQIKRARFPAEAFPVGPAATHPEGCCACNHLCIRSTHMLRSLALSGFISIFLVEANKGQAQKASGGAPEDGGSFVLRWSGRALRCWACSVSTQLTFPKSLFAGEQSNTRDDMKRFCFRVVAASCLGFYLLLWLLSQHDN